MTEEDYLSTLIVDSHASNADDLSATLKKYIAVGDCDYTNALYKAVQSFREEPFDLCFVSDVFPEEELKTLFADIEKLEMSHTCVWVQVRAEIKDDFDRSSLSEMGFTTIISRKCTFADISALTKAIEPLLRKTEIKRKIINVDSTMELLMKEIDRVASDRRRGVESDFTRISSGFVGLETTFDQEVLDGYYKQLIQHSIESEIPPEFVEICVPDEVLKRELPMLDKDGYSGVSRRVWQKLAKKHGVKESS